MSVRYAEQMFAEVASTDDVVCEFGVDVRGVIM
jgi:hypothetical protein